MYSKKSSGIASMKYKILLNTISITPEYALIVDGSTQSRSTILNEVIRDLKQYYSKHNIFHDLNYSELGGDKPFQIIAEGETKRECLEQLSKDYPELLI
jgi:hypothetical protein